jgi:hypothetical protein
MAVAHVLYLEAADLNAALTAHRDERAHFLTLHDATGDPAALAAAQLHLAAAVALIPQVESAIDLATAETIWSLPAVEPHRG